jgi:hypothetical protein
VTTQAPKNPVTTQTSRRDATGTVAAILAALPWATAVPLLLKALLAVGFDTAIATAALKLIASPPHEPAPEGRAGQQTAQSEVDYRAAYLLAAATRLNTAVAAGSTLVAAVAAERLFRAQHDTAVIHRHLAARAVDRAAAIYGDTLGWYLGARKTHTPVCLAAAGRTFSATRRPLPGWPGTAHATCGCHPGPPLPGAGSVDDATRALLAAGLD